MTLLPRVRLLAFLELTRPANIVTAHADILLGVAASGVITLSDPYDPLATLRAVPLASLLLLLLASTGLYGGGVVLNDVCDAQLDAQERPERPIPSGRVARKEAAVLAAGLLLAGILAACCVSLLSGTLACAIGASVILYDASAKHHPLWGPLTMGLCRGGNLLMGISILPASVSGMWYLATLPMVYIAAITLVSRGEVHGGDRRQGFLAVALICMVLAGTLALELLQRYRVTMALPFALLFATRVLPPFIRAARSPQPEPIRNAVMVGVLSLILLDAMVAAGFSGWLYGLMVLLLYPLSRTIAKCFAVT